MYIYIYTYIAIQRLDMVPADPDSDVVGWVEMHLVYIHIQSIYIGVYTYIQGIHIQDIYVQGKYVCYIYVGYINM